MLFPIVLSQPGTAELSVFALDGRRVFTASQYGDRPGQLVWKYSATDGRRLPPGSYLVRIRAGDSRESYTVAVP